MSTTEEIRSEVVRRAERPTNDLVDASEAEEGDVATLIRARLAAERRVAELEAVFQSIPYGICVADTEGVGFANKAALEGLGFDSAEDFQKRGWSDESFRHALLGERSVAELRLTHHKTGGDRVLRTVTAPVELDSRVVGAVSVITDVTERAAAEAALKASEERFRTLALATSELVWSADAQGSEVEGTKWLDALHPDDEDRVREIWANCVATGTPYRCEFRMRQPDGSFRDVRARGVPILGPDGQVREWIGLTVDITEKRRAEAERAMLWASERAARADAEQANRMKDELLAGVSHELATPLLGMRLWLELIPSGNPTQRQEAIAALHQCVAAQSKLVRDLLDTARAVNGKLNVALEPCDASASLESAVAAIRPVAEQKGLALSLNVERTPSVEADPARLQQIALNLLSNAVKFTPPGGRIDVSVLARGNGVALEVRDSGCGFTPEFRPLLFQAFRQAEEGTMRSQGGLGLGLAIVRQLVELHGGRVDADSPGPGRGAVFSVWLPRRHDVPDSLPAHLLATADLRLKGLRILLVDDDALTREALASVLEQHGASVQPVPNAAAGLEALGRSLHDVILSDIAMPGEDGYTFIRKVRALGGRSATLPAAALTAHMRKVDSVRALSAGFQMHIPKSVDVGQLITRVRTLAEGIQAEAS